MRLRLAGSSLAQVARDLGVQPTTVTSVSLGQRRSRRIEGRIAETLQTAPSALWPERYLDAPGTKPSHLDPGGAAPSSPLR
ncbi:MAG: helix-turn-helix domain-containing protein [Proteobacteria bacterium]|nr:helix-turn-helix domain-containing protein [Pseudomonadota bacterium]